MIDLQVEPALSAGKNPVSWAVLFYHTSSLLSGHTFLRILTSLSKARHPRGTILGKKKILSEEEIADMVLPTANDVLGVAMRLLGFDRVLVKCQDGHERLCRIRGKMKRRVWIRQGDIVLVSPWDFQSDKRGDVIWRYKRNQVEWLRRKGYLTLQV